MATAVAPVVKQTVVEIEGALTDIVVTGYTDRVFVVVSQMGKLGTLLEAQQSTSALALPGKIDYDVRTLLGKRDESLYTLFARRLIEVISKTDKRGLLLAVALRKEAETAGVVRACVAEVLKCRVWRGEGDPRPRPPDM